MMKCGTGFTSTLLP